MPIRTPALKNQWQEQGYRNKVTLLTRAHCLFLKYINKGECKYAISTDFVVSCHISLSNFIVIYSWYFRSYLGLMQLYQEEEVWDLVCLWCLQEWQNNVYRLSNWKLTASFEHRIKLIWAATKIVILQCFEVIFVNYFICIFSRKNIKCVQNIQ